MRTRTRLLAALAGGITPLLFFTSAASAAPGQQCSQEITVHSGQTYVVSATTCLHRLTVEPGGTVAPLSGDSLTLTVNGVETGQKLPSSSATTTVFVPGTYRGHVALTVDQANDVLWPLPVGAQTLTFPLR